jgi:uncharacterized membrane protein YphA (DoxX/SURF4 family)
MNRLLWVLQLLAALVYTASGVTKVFLFEAMTADVPSFGALPRAVWGALGILELVCVVGLLVPRRSGLAAAILAAESLVFIGVHVTYGELGSIAMSAVLGLVMAFVAYGRLAARPGAPVGA